MLYWDASFLHHIPFLLLSTIAAKKKRSAGRQAKDTVPESTNKSVFVTFLREAGVTLRQGGTSNEIGKPLALWLDTLVDEIVMMLQNFRIFSSIFSLLSCWSSCFSKKATTEITKESQVPWGEYTLAGHL